MTDGFAAADDGEDAAIGRTARRYRACGRFTRHYVASKLVRDPVHRALLRGAGPEGYGAVLDLGCGRGQVGVLLLEAGLATAVTGMDRAGPALADARRAAAGLAYAAAQVDLATPPQLPEADTVLLIDVLYQMGERPAVDLLRRAAMAARRRVMVRALDPAQGWRSWLAAGLEQIGRLGWPHSGRHVAPVPVPALGDALTQAGFTVETSPCWEGTPFANVLLHARR